MSGMRGPAVISPEYQAAPGKDKIKSNAPLRSGILEKHAVWQTQRFQLLFVKEWVRPPQAEEMRACSVTAAEHDKQLISLRHTDLLNSPEGAASDSVTI